MTIYDHKTRKLAAYRAASELLYKHKNDFNHEQRGLAGELVKSIYRQLQGMDKLIQKKELEKK